MELRTDDLKVAGFDNLVSDPNPVPSFEIEGEFTEVSDLKFKGLSVPKRSSVRLVLLSVTSLFQVKSSKSLRKLLKTEM